MLNACLKAILEFQSSQKIENFPKNLGIESEGILGNAFNKTMGIFSKSYSLPYHMTIYPIENAYYEKKMIQIFEKNQNFKILKTENFEIGVKNEQLKIPDFKEKMYDSEIEFLFKYYSYKTKPKDKIFSKFLNLIMTKSQTKFSTFSLKDFIKVSFVSLPNRHVYGYKSLQSTNEKSKYFLKELEKPENENINLELTDLQINPLENIQVITDNYIVIAKQDFGLNKLLVTIIPKKPEEKIMTLGISKIYSKLFGRNFKKSRSSKKHCFEDLGDDKVLLIDIKDPLLSKVFVVCLKSGTIILEMGLIDERYLDSKRPGKQLYLLFKEIMGLYTPKDKNKTQMPYLLKMLFISYQMYVASYSASSATKNWEAKLKTLIMLKDGAAFSFIDHQKIFLKNYYSNMAMHIWR